MVPYAEATTNASAKTVNGLYEVLTAVGPGLCWTTSRPLTPGQLTVQAPDP